MNKQAYKTHNWVKVKTSQPAIVSSKLYECSICKKLIESNFFGLKCPATTPWHFQERYEDKWNGIQTCESVLQWRKQREKQDLETEQKTQAVLNKAKQYNLKSGYYWVTTKDNPNFMMIMYYTGQDVVTPSQYNWKMIVLPRNNHYAMNFSQIDTFQYIEQPESLKNE